MGTSEIEIVSNALVKLGQKSITGFDPNNQLHTDIRVAYKTSKEELFQEAFWRFATESKQLSRLAEQPEMYRWRFAFAKPATPAPIVMFRPTPFCDYEIFENKIFTNQPHLRMDYVYLAKEDKFTPLFKIGLIYQVTANIAFTVTKSIPIQKLWMGLAQSKIQDATATEAFQYPAVNISRNILEDIHYENGISYDSIF